MILCFYDRSEQEQEDCAMLHAMGAAWAEPRVWGWEKHLFVPPWLQPLTVGKLPDRVSGTRQ